MNRTELLRRSGMWIETALAGSLPPPVRRVMRIELSMSLAYGVFYASIIPFTPVVMRRLGASVDMLALYSSLVYIGSVFTSFSVVLMRRRRTINLIVFCWLLGRSLFLPHGLHCRCDTADGDRHPANGVGGVRCSRLHGV